MNNYTIGQTVILSAFITEDGAPIDPTTLTLTMYLPLGGSQDLTSTITHDGTGNFTAIYVPAQLGTYSYDWMASGNLIATGENSFTVSPQVTIPISGPPTLGGFIQWAFSVMGIPTTVMAQTDPGYAIAFQIALSMVPCKIAEVDPAIYMLTVYNWGGSQILNFQPDMPGQKFFANARASYGINDFKAGVVEAGADQNTSESLAIGRGLRDLDLISLQKLKDPYGRAALGYMQAIGPLWGLS